MKTINLIYAVSFLDLLAVGLTFPLFSSYLKDIGASHTTIGLVSSAYSGIQVISGPLIGSWSDIRDRRTVLQCTLLLCAVFYGLLGCTSSIMFIFIVRFLLAQYFISYFSSAPELIIKRLSATDKDANMELA